MVSFLKFGIVMEDNYSPQIFPPHEKIENINDQYWTLRAEEVCIVPSFLSLIMLPFDLSTFKFYSGKHIYLTVILL